MSYPVQRLQTLFAQALDIADAAAREEFLERSCAGEPQLLSELRTLLSIDEQWPGDTAGSPFSGLGKVLEQAVAANTMEGMRVGAYRLCELLGQGGMGSVYRAERVDGSVEQQVAIKFVRREVLTPHTLRRFQFERQTLAALDHPQIARLLDAAQLDDGTPYLVMEFIDGLPITDYCQTHKLGLQRRLQLFLQVCAAVAHAHRKLVVHRDLKPGNILVTADSLKLLDFGVAKTITGTAAAPDADLTGTAQRFFSPRYAAPEQVLGEAISVACDVYALGLLLYELLSGQCPFDFAELRAGQIEHLIVAVPPPLASSRCLPVSEHPIHARVLRGDLDAIIARCLRKAPMERYHSVEQLQADLLRYVHGRPVRARAGHGLYRLRKFVERNRWNVLFALGAFVLLTVALLALWLQNQALQRERDLSQQSLAILKDSFAAADPLRAAGADTSARSVLDAARLRIADLREEQPELFIELARNIADAYSSLGRMQDAQTLFQQSIAASPNSSGPDNGRIAMQLGLVGTQIAQGQLSAAEAELATLGAISHTVEWQASMGQLRAAQGRFEEAITLLRAAYAYVQSRSALDPLSNRIRMALAESLRRSGNGDAALAMLDETLRWQSASLPAHSAQLLRTRLRRVIPLRDAGRLSESLAQAEAVAEDIERTYGSSSPTTAYAQSVRGLALQALGSTTEARAAQMRALQIWRNAFGADHPNTLRTQFNLAIALQSEPKELQQSERLLRDALRLSDAREGANAAISLYYRLHLGLLLRARQQPLEALQILLDTEWLGLNASDEDNRRRHVQTVQELSAQLCAPSQASAQTTMTSQCNVAQQWLQQARDADRASG